MLIQTREDYAKELLEKFGKDLAIRVCDELIVQVEDYNLWFYIGVKEIIEKL